MDQNPKTPEAYGIEMSKVWTQAGMPFPINPGLLALEISKTRYEDRIAVVHGHSVTGIDGMLTKSSKANEWFILYDETIQVEGRINFTIAHEFGHYLLHRELESAFECSQSKILGYAASSTYRRIEKEANVFASYLLMPLDDYRRQVSNNQMSLDLLGHCADRYKVSMTAAALKWSQFTEEVGIVVVATDGFILWAASSRSAKKLGINFNKGDPIPPLAEERLSRGTSSNKVSVRHPAGVWHPAYEAVEDLIVSDKYEVDIFLITFPHASSPEHEEEHFYDTLDVMNLVNNK